LCGRIAMLKQGHIVANDTTQNLLRRFSGCYVNLQVQSPRLPDALQPLIVQQGEGSVRLALRGYDELESVLAALRAAGIRINEMEVVQPDLEEVFVKIMNNEGREARGERREADFPNSEEQVGAK
jgi:ABC-2 type transport system ATP-binding protein